MVKKISFKKLIVALIILISFLLILSNTQPEEEVLGSKALDFDLKEKLMLRVNEALSIYSEEGWEEARKMLVEVSEDCQRGHCDPEVFFNKSLDDLANTFSNQEFTQAGEILGIIYPGNWELSDLDNDQENEVVVLQRDAFNPSYTILKVVDFQNDARVVSRTLEEGYLSSPNSSGGGLKSLESLDLTGDAIPEIILFLSPGRGGAKLHVFQYQLGNLKLLLKKDDLLYSEYIFSDVDRDGILEIIAKGYDPEREEKVREVLNLSPQP